MRRARAAGLLLAVMLLAAGTAHAQSGTVMLPCSQQFVQVYLNPPQGMCGYKVNVIANASFTLTPGKPADLDIYFYSATWQFKGVATAGQNVCGKIQTGQNGVGSVPDGSRYGVVVLSVSECGNIYNVPFTYFD